MDENLTEGVAESHPGRRTVIKGAAAGAVGVWALPVVTSFTSPAYAAGSAGNPHPECQGAECGNFKNCSSTSDDCLCFTTSSGGGLCFPGLTLCADLVACSGPNQDQCPSGSLCVVRSCCGYPICVPPDIVAACPPNPAGAGAAKTARRSSSPGTAGG